MKNKLCELLKKYKIAIFIASGIIIIGLIIIVISFNLIDNLSLKKFENNKIILNYDKSWKIISDKGNKVSLKHNKGSELNIEVISLENEYKYLEIDEMLDDLLYDLEKQNTNFKLISKKSDTITKNEYAGYKMLYENGNRQAMVVICKKSDNLIMFVYEATNEYFDILLDSVHNIIYDFDMSEQKFDLKHDLKLETSNISYNVSDIEDKLMKETTQYEVASNNYYVKYSIPSNFEMKSLNSTYSSFELNDLEDSSLEIKVNILNRNIYEHLDKDKTGSVYSDWSYYRNHEDYSKFEESLDKFDSDYDSYIYKNSYYYDKKLSLDENFNVSYTSELKENIVLIYALDKNHIIIFGISSSNVSIPKNLVNMIKIDSKENYSSYIVSVKENGYLVSSLKRKLYGKDEIEEVKLRMPEKYKEIDLGYITPTNIYEQRNYVLGYNDELEVHDYEIEYNLTSLNIDSQVDIISNLLKYYDEYRDFSYSGEKTLNGKNFKIYDGGYTEVSGIMFTSENRIKYNVNVKVLFYELSNGGSLKITIKGNNLQISDEMLNDSTNFEVN